MYTLHSTGTKFNEVYQTVVKKVQKNKPELAGSLTKSFGFVSGIEFRESSLSINAKNENKVQKGEVLVNLVCIEATVIAMNSKTRISQMN